MLKSRLWSEVLELGVRIDVAGARDKVEVRGRFVMEVGPSGC